MQRKHSDAELKDWARGQRASYIRGSLAQTKRLKCESIVGWRWLRQTKTAEQVLHIAECIAEKQPDGMLPTSAELIKSGNRIVISHKRKRPDLFGHITKRTRLEQSIITHIVRAEKIAGLEVDGRLPSHNELKAKGNLDLARCVVKFPLRFSHIEQRKLKLTTQQRVIEAEQLAAQNCGVLPSNRELIRRGLYGILNSKCNHAKEFAHIAQLRLKPGPHKHLTLTPR